MNDDPNAKTVKTIRGGASLRMGAREARDRVDGDDICNQLAGLENWLDEAVPTTEWLDEFLYAAHADVSALRRQLQKELDQ